MAVTPMNKLLVTLRFYALGTMVSAVADYININKSTACKIIYKVTDAIARLAPDEIKFPNTEVATLEIQRGFYNIARFPRVIGAIDCTHVKIQSPGK